MKKTLLIIFSLLLVNGCVQESKYNKVLEENVRLKNELEELKYGAEKLLNKANTYYKNKQYEKCNNELNILLSKHPESGEAKEGQRLLTDVKEIIKKLAEEKKRIEEEEKEKIEREKQEKLASATKKMRSKYDDMREMTWYYDNSLSKYFDNVFKVYIGKSDAGNVWLRLRIEYKADDWLFIEKYLVSVDGIKYSITENNYGEIKTDSKGGGIKEWLDRGTSKEDLNIIKAIANGDMVKIRHIGNKYVKDRIISNKEKIAIKNVLDAFEALGGKL